MEACNGGGRIDVVSCHIGLVAGEVGSVLCRVWRFPISKESNAWKADDLYG